MWRVGEHSQPLPGCLPGSGPGFRGHLLDTGVVEGRLDQDLMDATGRPDRRSQRVRLSRQPCDMLAAGAANNRIAIGHHAGPPAGSPRQSQHIRRSERLMAEAEWAGRTLLRSARGVAGAIQLDRPLAAAWRQKHRRARERVDAEQRIPLPIDGHARFCCGVVAEGRVWFVQGKSARRTRILDDQEVGRRLWQQYEGTSGPGE